MSRQKTEAHEPNGRTTSTPTSMSSDVSSLSSSAPLLQRAQTDPTSLTPADVFHLQRSIGNRATGRLVARQLSVQTKLQLGPATDKYEQEADNVARQVVRRMAAPPVQRHDELGEEVQAKPLAEGITSPLAVQSPPVKRTFVTHPLQRQAMDEEEGLAQASPQHGMEGGEVEASVAETIQRARCGGSALDVKTRYGMESAFGADFGGVRVHTDAQADTLNRSLNARAFTTGNDIFFRKGEFNPGSSGGKELLAHELTHTVQQGGSDVQRSGSPAESVSRVHEETAQRDIGFEFESNTMYTKRTNRRQALPMGGFPNAGAGAAAWNAPQTTRVAKGKSLLRRNDIEVQADDRPDGSDLEVVTTHFPLDVPGRTRLNNAMGDLTTLVGAYGPLRATGGGVVPAVALNGTAGFASTMRDGLIGGNWAAATTAPQVTIGTRIGNIGDIVRDLHGDPHETAPEKATRDPGRLRFRRPDAVNVNEPRPLNALDEASTLINGHTLARGAIASYQAIVDVAAPGGSGLEGLLTIIFTYCEGMQHKQAFLKQHTPLMAKTNLATIFTTLPGPVQTYYSQRDPNGVTNLEKVVAQAPGYDTRMAQPLFQGVGGVAEDDQPLGQPQWYHRLTLESWVRGIVLRDRTRGEAFKQWFKDNWGGSTQRPGKDQLTTKSFPGRPRGQEIEGYGALGRRMDVDPATGDALPVFELRAANRPITFAAAQQWALDLFDYVQSLNANPGGGYNHIV